MGEFEYDIRRRRAYVAEYIKSGNQLTPEFKKSTADLFNCSVASIRSDWKVMARIEETGTLSITPLMRRKVKVRDSSTCQYCGEVTDSHHIDHVVPSALGGVTDFHNVVYACAWCNARKGANIWVPTNLDEITKDRPDWRDRVLESAVSHRPGRKRTADEPLRAFTIRVTNEEKILIRDLLKELRKDIAPKGRATPKGKSAGRPKMAPGQAKTEYFITRCTPTQKLMLQQAWETIKQETTK